MSYRFKHKIFKWWKCIFIELLEISVINAYILSGSSKNYDAHKNFRLNLIKGLLEVNQNNFKLPVENYHFPEYYDKNRRGTKKRKNCIVCGSKTLWICEKCSTKEKKFVSICLPNCFKDFHLKINRKK